MNSVPPASTNASANSTMNLSTGGDLKALASHYNSQGELKLGLSSTPLLKMIDGYERPFYLYDLKGLRARAKIYAQHTRSAKSFFAIKANANREILKVLREEGLGCDVVSGGELEVALNAGFKADEIVFSGVGKTLAEVKLAFQKGIHQINAESVPELVRLQKVASSQPAGAQMRVALRYNPDVNVHTHKYISTGLKENKFGMADEELSEALALFQNGQLPNLTFVGLSMHLGSQILDVSSVRDGVKRLVQKSVELRSQFSTVDIIDIGGGIGIDYRSDSYQAELTLLKIYEDILTTEIPSSFKAEAEPGRILVARSGVLISQVQYIKIRNDRTFVVLDAGMNHLMRPALYQAVHRVLPLQKRSSSVRRYDIVGPICESTDVFARDFEMSEVVEGDFVALMDAGAYGRSMSSGYNQHHLPEEKFLAD